MQFDNSPDVLIIGGGINGIGIARELAFRGVSVVVVEKGDLCSGTSSQSSKLVHGGIRYLEHGDFGLVADACRERFFLTQNAPHLVSVQPFILPIYNTDKRRPWMIRIGLFLYELLALHRRLGHNHMISVSKALQTEPLLRSEGLVGAAEYFDGKMDDSRLGIEMAMQAREMGAKFLTDTPVIGCRIDSNPEVTVLTNGIERRFTPRIVINAAGPWADSILGMTGVSKAPLLKPTLGIHLVTRPLVSTHALLISAASDNRVIFVIPHEGYSIVGTTDTPFDGSPDTAAAGISDIKYLVAEVQRVFNIVLGPSDIYATFAGLRPLLHSSATTTAAMSRDHALIRHTAHFMSIVGGKYTTFRSMSEEVAKAIMMGLDRPFSGTTRELQLPAGPFPTLESRRRSVVDSARYCIRNEFARHLSDFLRRRTDCYFMPGNGLDVADMVADVFASELGWSVDEKLRELSSYRQSIVDMHQQIHGAFS